MSERIAVLQKQVRGWRELLLSQIRLLPLVLFAPFLIFPEYFPDLVVVPTAVLLASYVLIHAWMAGRRYLSFFILLLPYPLLAGVSYWASAEKAVTVPKLYLLLTALATVLLMGGARTEARKRPGGQASRLPGPDGPTRQETVEGEELPESTGRPLLSGGVDTLLVPLSWLYLMAMLALGLMGPFITQFRWTSKFLDLRGWGLTLVQTGEILDINLYGCLMAISAPIALGLALSGAFRKASEAQWRRRLAAIFLWGAFAAFIGLLVVSQARAGLVGLIGGMAAFLLLSWSRGWIVVLLGAGALGVGLWALGVETIQEFVSQSGSLNSLESRLELWNRSMYAIQDFPFTGIGAGMFNKVIPLLYPLFLIAPDATPFHSHNLYLQTALDLGIGGLVAFSALIGLALISGVKAKRQLLKGGQASSLSKGRQASRLSDDAATDKKTKTAPAPRAPGGTHFLVVGYLSSLSVFLVNGLLDSPLWMNKPMAVPFFIIGMLIAARVSGPGCRVPSPGRELSAKDRTARREVELNTDAASTPPGAGGAHHAQRNAPNAAREGRSAQTGWRFWFDHVILFVLWVLISLVAISFVGDHPYWTLAIAIAGGLYLGWEASRGMDAQSR